MKRPRHSLPDDIAFALKKRWLTSAYEERPDYQRNDYVGWVNRAKLDATREQRTGRMLDELAEGGVNMGMARKPGAGGAKA